MPANCATLISRMVEYGLLRRSLEFLNYTDVQLRFPAIRVIGNVVMRSTPGVQYLIDKGLLDKLKKLLVQNELKQNEHREVLWIIGNVAAGNEMEIKAVCDAKLFPILIANAKSIDKDISKESLFAICNVLRGAESMAKSLIGLGVIEVMFAYLKRTILTRKNQHLFVEILHCFKKLLGRDTYHVFTKCDGFEILKTLRDQEPRLEEIDEPVGIIAAVILRQGVKMLWNEAFDKNVTSKQQNKTQNQHN